MNDPKARVRATLMNAPAAATVAVSRDDLAEVLRELGELRQIVQQQAKGLRDAGNAALAESRSMGRVFANAAAASALRENARLRRHADIASGLLDAPRDQRCVAWHLEVDGVLRALAEDVSGDA